MMVPNGAPQHYTQPISAAWDGSAAQKPAPPNPRRQNVKMARPR
jgi:hypothetical protein